MTLAISFGLLLLGLSPVSADPVDSNLVMYARYVAKEYCSCRYVVKQSKDICRSEAKATSIFVHLEEDLSSRSVLTRNVGGEAKAVWVNSRRGCELVE